jgi:hypothetical protein
VALSQTLHGQLFPLTYDRRRQTFDGDERWCFGLALRAAMLGDLYLTGHLEVRRTTKARATPSASPVKMIHNLTFRGIPPVVRKEIDMR